MKKLSLLLFLALPFLSFAQHKLVTADNGDKYLAGTINLKVKPEYRSACSQEAVAIPALLREMDLLGFRSIKKKFKTTKAPEAEYNERGQRTADITLIYTLKVAEETDIVAASRKLTALDAIEYAEPSYVSYDQYTPNDANLNSVTPYHYDNINAYEAWDITLGDTNVVIGITETAINVNHEDLAGNIKYNYDDPIGNGDDDIDTYVDNYAGWDMVDNDNNLFINNEIHGDAVSAIACASADNGIGYAGIGFKCKFIPIKVGNNSIVITHGYEGIEYAIEQGASIVNCSWGNTSYSQVAQDIVTFAAINNDVVLIASAGNATSSTLYYPASYNYVLSVTGVDQNDLFDNGFNPPFTYNDSVDVSAPGINIYTTATFNGGFLYSPPQGGTSMAAPIVAGIAGLVRSEFPCLTALEVIERIKATADPIDGITQNIPYAGMLGTGRVNAEMAVTGTPCSPVGIIERTSLAVLDIYPNPSSDEVNIRMSKSSDWNIEILDTKGRLVLSQSVQSDRLVLSNFPSGLYLARVSDKSNSLTKPFSVIKQ